MHNQAPTQPQRPFTKSPVVLAISFALLLGVSGCATNPDGSLKKNADGTLVIDEKAKGALMGAVAGCAIGAATSGDCAKGAIIGAVAGFLISWYFESQKLESAQTVNKEYAKAKNKNSRPPKNDVVPVTFTSKLEEEKPDASGRKEVKITSNTDLIGYGDKVPDVQQKYAIYDQNNKLVEEKTEKITSVDGAGRYQTSSKFKIAANAKDYTVKTQLISNNKMYKENSYKVSFSDDGNLTLMAQIQRDSASRIQ